MTNDNDLPRPIEPDRITPGMRVRMEQHSAGDATVIEATIVSRHNGYLNTQGAGTLDSQDQNRDWTLLAEPPKPAPAVGSRWFDPKTGAGYVVSDESGMRYRRYRLATPGYFADSYLDDVNSGDRDAIARLVPRAELDPATLWPIGADDQEWCLARDGNDPHYECNRASGHGGLHAAYVNRATVIAVWGDPR